ncbi:hypothetical protein F783_000170 [Bordetella holmesii F627]|nr:hypothetical protein F783_000170 [Bordetella holmesii F627]SUV95473.1 Uncharacterised protein [Bordetella holmesii]
MRQQGKTERITGATHDIDVATAELHDHLLRRARL